MNKKGKLHLVESYSFPRNTYKNVTKDSTYTNLVESAKHLTGNKTRINEASVIHKVKRILSESKITEDMQNKIFENLKEAGANINDVELWQFPVSKVNDKQHPNLNGRVYGKKLWENVIENQADVWKGGTGLANHPADDEDGDFMNQSIVWLDGFIGDDDIIYGIGTFVGEGGALARQIISVGGRIGFSTSGYGDFLSDGVEVDPETYEIDRFADLVLNPSQGVFGDHSDKINTTESVKNNKGLKESRNMKTNIKEAAGLKDILKAAESENSVEQLSKLADTHGLELNEGIAEDTSLALAAELTANSFKDMKADEVTAEQVEDTKTIVDAYKDEEDAEGKFKDIFKKSGVADDVVSTIFADKKDESIEEDETSSEEDSSDELEDEESIEDSDDSDLSLEERLLVDHYTKSMRAIGKEADELWEEKIQKLNNLVAKLKEAKLSNNVKTRLNDQTSNLIESIMKKARFAIQEGFRAKKICEDLGITTIAKLSNIKEKLEDFTSLEDCLEKTTKEANKYKALFEAKKEYAQSEAEYSYSTEEKARKLENRVKELKRALQESKEDYNNLKTKLLATKVKSVNWQEKYNKLVKENKRLSEQVKRVSIRNENLKDLINESEKTVRVLKANNDSIKNKLSEKNNRILELKDQFKESQERNNSLRSNQKRIVSENKQMQDELTSIKKAESLNRARKNLKESAIRKEKARKESAFYDTDLMFKDTGNIENFLESANIKNKEDYRGVKTLREAEDKYLFSNELLSEAADKERSSIGAPSEVPTTFEDLFN